MTTSDVYDEHREGAEVCELQLRDFGGTRSFSGRISTVRCHEDNVLVANLEVRAGQFGALMALCVPLTALEEFLGEKTVRFNFEILDDASTDKLASGYMTVVCVDRVKFKTTPIPVAIRKALAAA